MATAQMNVRLPLELKEAGDAAFASVGILPSQAVRALWSRAAERGQGLEKVIEVLREPGRSIAQDDALERAQAIVPDGLARLGISATAAASVTDAAQTGATSAHAAEIPYDELKAAAWAERLAERGLA